LTLLLLPVPASIAAEIDLPEGYWDEAAADAILEKTLTVRLAPDLAPLSSSEKTAVEHLLEVGRIFQKLYEDSRHHQALEAHQALEELDARLGSPGRTRKLLEVHRLAKGPIVTTLENKRAAFLPVASEVPGKNVYPVDLGREEMDRYLDTHPEERQRLLHLRGVVRRATVASLKRDLGTLRAHPALDTLHPGLRRRMEDLAKSPSGDRLYAVPYSVAWASEILQAYEHLNLAADAIHAEDEDFARFLRHRARDLLADDYDAGDAAWITGRFKSLNAQIGSYETYDDELYGVKSFFSLSLLKRDLKRSDALREAVRGLQEIEDLLPYEAHKRVREEIPIGVYDVVADFGQSRGRNSATILPNESHLARQYGRTILLRANILSDPKIFEMGDAAFRAAVHPDHHGDLTAEGNLQRILWHEIGHYLGVDRTRDGRELDLALEDASALLEEMKSDLVSLFAVGPLRKQGYYDDATLRSVYAGGILRTLQANRPRRVQPYQTMQLMQWNWFLEHGLLSFDGGTRTLRIAHERYPEVVRSLLGEVLALQHEGDREKAERFIERWTSWSEELHGVVAGKIRGSARYRYVLVRYAALGE
jgi:hypothetical protein